ncbi:MAG: glycosyltransferase family 4 protein [Oligoflexales bacterium]|nr:glycosyltransferase family 4 protein [Oligoflexales bacterium]
MNPKNDISKNILIIAERFYPEEFGINDLARELYSKGYHVSVLTQVPSYPFDKVYDGYENRLFQREDWDGICIYRIFGILGYKKSVFLKVLSYIMYAVQTIFVSFIVAGNCSKIYVYQPGPLTQALPGVLLKKFFGKKLFVWTLDVWPDSVFAYGFKKHWLSKKILDLFVKFIYVNCDTVFVSCEGFIPRIKEYAPNTKVVFTPQWVPNDLNFDNAVPHENMKGFFNFTFAGNIGKVQNLENVIKGFGHISDDFPQARLNIIGDGSNLEELKKLAETDKINNVVFWGRKPLKEMPDWFSGSDVLIISLIDSPVFSITVPAKFQAYLAADKALFCVMKGEVARIVNENCIGLVADPSSVESIAHGFKGFLSMNRDQLTRYRVNMRRLLTNDYSREKIFDLKIAHIFNG